MAANSANNVSGEPWVTFADRIGKIVIGNGVTEIGTSAFRDLKAVKELVIGKSVDTIGEFAFQGLASLTAVTIPDGVRTIKGWAFGDCSALSSVTIRLTACRKKGSMPLAR